MQLRVGNSKGPREPAIFGKIKEKKGVRKMSVEKGGPWDLKEGEGRRKTQRREEILGEVQRKSSRKRKENAEKKDIEKDSRNPFNKLKNTQKFGKSLKMKKVTHGDYSEKRGRGKHP